MKKILLVLTVFTMVFTSCNEIDDVVAEFDERIEANDIVGDIEYTLVDADYTTELDLAFPNFSSNEDARTLLPDFLANKYPALGVSYNIDGSISQASSALITYKLFSPIKFESYTVTDEDYAALELTSLNDNDDFNAFFDLRFPSEVQGTVIDLTYKTEPTLESYTLTDEDYDLVGNGRFDNFDIRAGRAEEDLEVRRSKIQTILLNNFPDAEFGTKFNVTYEVFDGSSSNLEMLVHLEENPTDPAKTTTYTLDNDDYALIGNGTFNNFDIRDTSPEADVEVRREKIETILLNNYPDAVAGEFYVITYDTFAGGDSRPVLTMILQFDGTNYNIFDVKIYAIYEFALVDNTMRFTLTDEWNVPITFTPEEYELLGGSSRFRNFSGNVDEAERKIAIYLKQLYPFAGAEDFVAVQYDFFSGSVSTRNTNFVYDGTVWNPIPTVINTSLQFGHNGTAWEPDNTIKYTLTSVDYALIGNGQFNNFDLRPGSPEESIEARLVKLNVVLKANFPNAEQGQKFAVTYAFFDGSRGTITTNVILEGSDYILQ